MQELLNRLSSFQFSPRSDLHPHTIAFLVVATTTHATSSSPFDFIFKLTPLNINMNIVEYTQFLNDFKITN